MKIALDLSWLPPQRAGAGRYAWELVNAFAALPDDNTYTIYAPPGAFDGSTAADDPRFTINSAMPTRRGARLAWEQAILPWRLRHDRPDILHIPHSQAPLAPLGVPLVVTFHDATYELFPERYPWLRRTYYRAAARFALRKARLIIAVSNRVKKDLEETLGVDAGRVRVVHEAAGGRFRPASAQDIQRIRERYGLTRPYVFALGSLEPGKGHVTLIEAMKAAGHGHDLVIAGQQAWGSAPAGGRYLGYVPDADLPPLYSGATAFAFPSMYEGFGLPLLEAMACGTPVVASAGSAISEIAGDAAVLVPAGNAQALAKALSSLLSDEPWRGELRDMGLARAVCFTWEKAARQTLEVYEEALASRSLPVGHNEA